MRAATQTPRAQATPWVDLAALPPKPSRVLETWRRNHGPETLRTLAKAKAAPGIGRSYAAAKVDRTTGDWVTLSTSADAELWTSLRTLRNRSRQLCRDNDYAIAAKRRFVTNIIGRGIAMQPEVKKRRGNDFDAATNEAIRAEWDLWANDPRSCHTAGLLTFAQIERQVVDSCVEAGELLVRLIRKRMGASRIPLALELIEADQLIDTYSGRNATNGNQIRMGVEVDQWMRPAAYWLYPRHPGDIQQAGIPQSNDYIRVPADEILHIGIRERPGQTRCVPWFHAAMLKLRHIGGYEEAEIVRARASASIMGFKQTPEVDLPDATATDADAIDSGDRVMDMAPGVILELEPGETFNGFNPSTPNPSIEPFMRFMLRSFAVGAGATYAGISGDYSQGNFAAERLAITDERKLWRVLQDEFITQFHSRITPAWTSMGVLAGALNLPAYETLPQLYHDVRWQPPGWEYMDPLKDAMAAKTAIRNGSLTLTDDLAARGLNLDDQLKRRQREIDLAKSYGLVFDTDPALVDAKGADQSADPAAEPASDPSAAKDATA